ncbi:MAG: GNAT family N-acetyltransferase [Bacteroidales bacterium]|nr:GNAT family N-acetyltransferase [Bacteroidales bacterium]
MIEYNNNSIEIRKVTTPKEIEYLLKNFDKEFTNNLTKRIPNLKEYAVKLSNNSINLVAIHNSEKLGFICFYCNDTKFRKAYISQLCVSELHRRKGIGNYLINEAIKYCNNEGMNTLDLEVAKSNNSAINLYKHNGFIETKDNPQFNSFLMRKKI